MAVFSALCGPQNPLPHGEFGGAVDHLRGGRDLYEHVLKHPYASAVLSQLAPAIKPEWMFRDLSTLNWHSDDRCPLLSRPFEHVQIAHDSLPVEMFERWMVCEHCEAARAFPVGRLVAVLLAALTVDPTGSDDQSFISWPLLAARRRFCFDPLSVCWPTARPFATFWDSMHAALSEWVVSISHRSAAAVLSPEPLYDALAAVTMPTTEEWLSGRSKSLPGSSPGATEKFANVFLVHQDLHTFCMGTPPQRIVDLFSLSTPLEQNAVLVKVPACLAPHVRAAAVESSMVLDDSADADTLRWAASLYLTAPSRTLPAALSAAIRLRRGPPIAVEGELQRPA